MPAMCAAVRKAIIAFSVSLATVSSFLLSPNFPAMVHDRKALLDTTTATSARTTRSSVHGLTSLRGSRIETETAIGKDLIEKENEECRKDSSVDLGFSFTCSGLHFLYQLGVVKALKDQGVITQGTPLAGSSGGSIVVATTAAGLEPDEVFGITQELFEQIEASGESGFGRFGEHLNDALVGALPENAHEKANSWDGGVLIGVSALNPTPSPLVVSSFGSKSELIDAVLASCHIPFYTSAIPVHRLSAHDLLAADGFVARVGTLGAPGSRARRSCIVTPFSRNLFSRGRIALRSAISQDQRPIVTDADPALLIAPEGKNWVSELPSMLLPASTLEVMDDLYAEGQRDAQRWLDSMEESSQSDAGEEE